MADRRRKTIDVGLDDVLTHLGEDMVAAITTNAHRYVDLFSQVIDELLPEPRTTLTDDDDVADVLAAHRYSQLQQARKEQAAQGQAPDPHQQLPPQLMRRCVSRGCGPPSAPPPPPRPTSTRSLTPFTHCSLLQLRGPLQAGSQGQARGSA